MEEDLKIKIVELTEALKYISKNQDIVDQDIKGLMRENSKQAEEIRDISYLTETLKTKLDGYEKGCIEHRGQNHEFIKEVRQSLSDLSVKLEKAAQKKIVVIIETILAAIVAIIGIIGTVSGAIKFVGW